MSSDSKSLTDLKPGVYKFIRTLGNTTVEVYTKISGQSVLMISFEETPKLRKLLKFVDIRLIELKYLKDVLVDYTMQEPISYNMFTEAYVRAINRFNAAVDYHEFDLIRKKDAVNYVEEDGYGFVKR